MPRVTVVDVGDGACSVLRCGCLGPPCRCEVAVLDCGAYKASHQPAMKALRTVLRPDGLRRLGTLIVSHFDADHWAGLQLLGAKAKPSELAPAVRIAYPRLPDRAPDTFAAELALFETVKGTGVRPLDLVNTWRERTKITPLPLYREMVFEAVGRQWRVLWPPRELPPHQLAALIGAVQDVEQLAKTLAAAGDSTLKDNLEAARESPLPRDPPEEGGGAWPESEALPSLPGPDNDIEEEQSYDHDSEPPGRFPDLGKIPGEHRAEFARVSRRLARANNNLSLIFYDLKQHLIAYGDANEPVLRRALVGSPSHFRVALAPHHGTVPVPSVVFPAADACVSQAGKCHRQRWCRHVESHGQERSCVNTADVGTISFW